jgi:2-oxoglutarate dehydrogenase E1 component
VVLGKARAKQTMDRLEEPDCGGSKVIPLLLHGDAAFAGQGVVAECFALMGLKGYRTGRTIHCHRQQPDRLHHQPALLALLALSVGRGADGPGAHLPRQRRRSRGGGLRGQDRHRVPPAVRKDVVLDVFCYRRFGHNEGDDPTFTQPIMYRKIKEQPVHARALRRAAGQEGVVTREQVDAWVREFEAFLDAEFEAGKSYRPTSADWLDGMGRAGPPEGDERRGETAVPAEKLRDYGAS